MSKAVLLSIRPKYCELIAEGEKTIEVRKTRPKIETPFKCYVYQTMTGYVSKSKENDVLVPVTYGKVIGEFVCDGIKKLIPIGFDKHYHYWNTGADFESKSCLSEKELLDYGNDGVLYGWHISGLVIYDEPKELSEFRHCGVNYHSYPTYSRPPQSWCYVEELK